VPGLETSKLRNSDLHGIDRPDQEAKLKPAIIALCKTANLPDCLDERLFEIPILLTRLDCHKSNDKEAWTNVVTPTVLQAKAETADKSKRPNATFVNHLFVWWCRTQQRNKGQTVNHCPLLIPIIIKTLGQSVMARIAVFLTAVVLFLLFLLSFPFVLSATPIARTQFRVTGARVVIVATSMSLLFALFVSFACATVQQSGPAKASLFRNESWQASGLHGKGRRTTKAVIRSD
jgi:hypothetical protein